MQFGHIIIHSHLIIVGIVAVIHIYNTNIPVAMVAFQVQAKVESVIIFLARPVIAIVQQNYAIVDIGIAPLRYICRNSSGISLCKS